MFETKAHWVEIILIGSIKRYYSNLAFFVIETLCLTFQGSWYYFLLTFYFMSDFVLKSHPQYYRKKINKFALEFLVMTIKSVIVQFRHNYSHWSI